MAQMFEGASRFNQPLNDWNVSKVKDMNKMFCKAAGFNQPLNDWNVSNVENMVQMFDDALSFNQPLDFVPTTCNGMEAAGAAYEGYLSRFA